MAPLSCLCLYRFSVNVFQPPFQTGRTSPETSQCRSDLPLVRSLEAPGSRDETLCSSSTVGAGDLELENPSLLAEDPGESAQASALLCGESDSHSSFQTSLSTTRTSDSGFSEQVSPPSCCSLDPYAEKETSCEKAIRPEGNSMLMNLCLMFSLCCPNFLFLTHLLQLQ